MGRKLNGYGLTRWSNSLSIAGLVGIKQAARVDGEDIELHSGAMGG